MHIATCCIRVWSLMVWPVNTAYSLHLDARFVFFISTDANCRTFILIFNRFRSHRYIPGSKFMQCLKIKINLMMVEHNFGLPLVWFQAQRTREITEDYKVITYNIRVTMPQYFRLPSTVEIPVTEETNVPWENPSGKPYNMLDVYINSILYCYCPGLPYCPWCFFTDCESVEIPIWFQADRVGQFPCQVVLKSSSDTRLFMLEAHVTSQVCKAKANTDTATWRYWIQSVQSVCCMSCRVRLSIWV